MRVKLNGGFLGKEYPLYKSKTVIIGIDSSKTNTAIYILDSAGNDLDYIEIQGAEDKDVLELCFNQRKTLAILFKDCSIKYCGIEDIVTKKNAGMDTHASRFKITAVFMSIISCFQDNFNFTPELVNNWSWKAGVLPQQYRTDDHHKGSKDWLKSIGHKLGHCKDDVTDAYCIAQFIKLKHGVDEVYGIESIQAPMCTFLTSLETLDSIKRKEYRLFRFNYEFSLQQNLNYMANNTPKGCLGAAEIMTNSLTPKFIYENVKGEFSKVEMSLYVTVEV